MKYRTDHFEQLLAEFKLQLTDRQIDQFLRYYEMLIEKNKVMNLTAITEFEDVMEKHFADSLSAVLVQDFADSLSLIDVGTGAGFPGIPLKIAFPELTVVLADSLKKRLVFLDEVIDALDLKGIETVHGRAEDLAHEAAHREQYDLCVSRAVAKLSTLAEYCLPFVKIGGRFISYKSGDCEAEAAAAKSSVFLLGGKVEEQRQFLLGDAGRSLIVIQKNNGTPKKYPRKAGVPSKNPL